MNITFSRRESMKRIARLFVACLAVCSLGAQGRGTPKQAQDSRSENMANKSWFIEVAPDAGIVVRNAAKDLQEFLVRRLNARILQRRNGNAQGVTLGTWRR